VARARVINSYGKIPYHWPRYVIRPLTYRTICVPFERERWSMGYHLHLCWL